MTRCSPLTAEKRGLGPSLRHRTASAGWLTPFSGTAAVWIVSALLALAAVLLILLALGQLPALQAPVPLQWWILALGFALAEIFIVQLHFRRDAHSFSLSELPLAIGLFFLTPVELIAAQVVGAGAALWLHRKQPALKLFFNLANLAFSAAVAVLVFRTILGTGDPLGPAGWLGTFAAALTANLLTLAFIVVAIGLSLGRAGDVRRLFATGAAATSFNTSLALIAVTIIWRHPAATWLLFVLALVLFLGYRAYGSLRQNHERLELVYSSTKAIQGSLESDTVIDALLEHARSTFRAELAEVLLFVPDTDGGQRTRLGPGNERTEETVTLDPTEGVWARLAADRGPILLARPIANERLREHFAARGITEAMVVPLVVSDQVVGILLVANRPAPMGTFEAEDLQVLETLANHGTVAIQNGRLVERLRRQAEVLRFQALHDALTGLPNRAFFRDRLEEALGGTEAARGAVAILDLDRFKEVNDTLGHHNGDLLLQELGGRLGEVLGGAITLARLSGDEFAVLIPSAGRKEASEVCRRILESLETPFNVQDLQLHVGGSIGVALYPEHGNDADTLIQRADVAMYLAKASHSGFELYAQSRDQYSPSRLALVGELRESVENRELLVVYQPKADLASGRIVGAEALVRWHHPRRGFIPPDEFISIAEHTGLIRPLTRHVLDTALHQCAVWRAAGLQMSVAVNISVRSLLDMELARAVERALHNAGVRGDALELEVTESTIMSDPAATVALLERIASLGVGIAIDDFGTGYSSLAYLKRLPVDEIKIDRSFVSSMATDDNDALIVRSTIELGHNLGLRVVAEGVEDRGTWDRLAALGCDQAQGFYLSRPVPAEQVTRLLLAQRDVPPSEGPSRLPLRLVAAAGSRRRPSAPVIPARDA